MIEDDALVVVVAVAVTVVGLMLVAADVSNDGDTAFSVIFVDVDGDDVVVVAAIFDDLGLFQSPKRLQAFFHLH